MRPRRSLALSIVAVMAAIFSLVSVFSSGRAASPRAGAPVFAARLKSGHLVGAADRHAALRDARRAAAKADDDAGPEALHPIVFLERPPSPGERDAMQRAGVTLLDPLPRLAWRAAVSPQADLDTAPLQAIRSLAFPGPAHTIDPALRVASPAAPTAVIVHFHHDIAADDGRRMIARHDGRTVATLPSIHAQAVVLPGQAIARLAQEDAVAWIEPALPMLTGANDGVRSRLAIEPIWSDPIRGLTGAGIDVLVFDLGRVDNAHADFGSRVIVGDAVTPASHSTHVAGTLAGSGALSAGQYAGVAPGANIVTYALSGFNAGIFMYSNPGDIQYNFTAAILTHGVDVANISLGSNIRLNAYPCDAYGTYGATDRLLDAIVTGSLGVRLPLVVAGGNERPSPACSFDYATTAPPAGAKNVLSVGSVDSDDGLISSFSAWGPTDDGRMKPDLVAPGCQNDGDRTITSTLPGNTYGAICGTSMAAPAVTGVLALLLEDSRARALPDPPPAALRALAYHSAIEVGPQGPDYTSGFGLLDPRGALDLMRADAVRQGAAADGGVEVIPILVTDPNLPFLATLAWDDPPASAGAATALVNDLDLRVYDPAGTRRHPYTLDPAFPATPATQDRENHLDNAEKVFAPAGMTGLWRVEVAGSLVVSALPQEWSLIVTGGASPAPIDATLIANRTVARCEDAVSLTFTDASAAGAVTTSVTVASTTDPVGIPVTLAETAQPGVFTSPLTIGTGGLAVGHGDMVTVSHAAGPAVAFPVDCQPPVISAITVSLLDSHSAQVSWLTDEPADTRLDYAIVTRGMSLAHAVPLGPFPSCSAPGPSIGSADPAGNLAAFSPVSFETLDETLLFFDNFENGAIGWDNPDRGGGSNVVQWNLTSLAYASPVRAFTDSPGEPYADNKENELISPPMDMRGHYNGVVTFRHKYALEEGFDYGYLDYSVDRSHWTTIGAWTGETAGFITARTALPAETDNLPEVWLRFRLKSDNSLAFDGWTVDDVRLFSRADCSEVMGVEFLLDETTGLPRLSWEASPSAASYNIYRGDLPMIGVDGIATSYGGCLAASVPGTTFDDATADPALAYFYLVTGVGASGEGIAGFNSAGDRRPMVACP